MIEKETLRQRVLYPLLRMTGCLFFLQPRIIIVIIYSTVFGSESTQGGVVAMRLRFFFFSSSPVYRCQQGRFLHFCPPHFTLTHTFQTRKLEIIVRSESVLSRDRTRS